jgi:hypothetical protein
MPTVASATLSYVGLFGYNCSTKRSSRIMLTLSMGRAGRRKRFLTSLNESFNDWRDFPLRAHRATQIAGWRRLYGINDREVRLERRRMRVIR